MGRVWGRSKISYERRPVVGVLDKFKAFKNSDDPFFQSVVFLEKLLPGIIGGSTKDCAILLNHGH